MPSDDAILELVQVTKQFRSGGDSEPLTVLDDLNERFVDGESVAIVGPSGCGKSTLLNLLGALDRPTSGRVVLEGEDLAGMDDLSLARVRNRKFGFVFQAHHLLPQCNVLENVLLPTLAFPGPDRTERARALLERVGLKDRMHHRPAQLSGGEKQRAAVVRGLINQPKALLADEPTGALDFKSSQLLGELLLELNRSENVTLIVVTHSLELAGSLGRILRLDQGKLADGSAKAA